MKAKQAARKIRSLYFRQKLLEEFPELETEVKELVEETGITFLGGFRIEGDDLKAAATDALKKCATLLGVGLHLYRNDQPANSSKTNNQPRKENDRQSNGNGKPNGGKGMEAGRKMATATVAPPRSN